MFISFVRRVVYEKLLAAAPNGAAEQKTAAPPSETGGEADGKPSGSPPNLPKSWANFVIAHENADESWYEAIVAEANGDMLTLRWRV
jgi:hypothetical protein